MHISLHHQPGNTAARVLLAPGESCTTEAGAMIAMSAHMKLETSTHKRGKGSIGRAVKRLLAGESLFLNHFYCEGTEGEVWLGTDLAGDMQSLRLDEESLIVQGGSFLAAESAVNIDMAWQGFKSFFSGERIFWVKLEGTGNILLSSFGAIYPIDVDGEVIVDTGHIVAFEETLDFSISKAGRSWISSFLGGEGLVCRISGRGRVWCQSHNPGNFGAALSPGLKVRRA